MKHGVPQDLRSLYPAVPYHNLNHTESFQWDLCPSPEAYWAAVFHDFVYYPGANDNEEKSFQKFLAYNLLNGDTKVDIGRVQKLIMSTKDHVKYFDPGDKDMVWLHQNDLACFRSRCKKTKIPPIEEVERLIFKEYQFIMQLNWYKEKRIGLLNYYKKHPLVSDSFIDEIIFYLSNWQPKYGIYVGSFNPFHRGHWDIFQQADKVFDKVIIAQGQNEDKPNNEYCLSSNPDLQLYHTEQYSSNLFDYINYKKETLINVALIRGLRSPQDFNEESALFNFGQELTDVPTVYFISKSENAFISSSGIKKLKAIGKDVSQYLAPK